MNADGFLLGLSTGVFCISSCAPLIFPFLFSVKQKNAKGNAAMVSLFLAGRLLGYLAAGFILGSLGSFAAGFLDPGVSRTFTRISYPVAGLFMIAAALLLNFPEHKFCKAYSKVYSSGRNSLILGLVTGFSLCPPFFAAAARVFGQQSSLQGMFYFFLFFLGTSVYFLPLFGIHFLKKHLDKVRMFSRVAMLLIGIYYLVFLGIIGG